MTPRRKETTLPTEQPVRFYKFVALTFLAITLVLLGVIVFLSSKRVTITIETKKSPVDVSMRVGADDVGGEMSTSTIAVTKTFTTDGETAVPGQATGMMTIVNDSGIPQPLVATTRFLSADGVLFRLRNRVDVPANGQIEAEVYADQEGEGGNIGPSNFTIPGLNEARQQQVYGRTTAAMEGGVQYRGVVTQNDIVTAEETLREEALVQAQAGLDTSSTLVMLIGDTSETSAAVGDEVTSFDVTLTATALLVRFDQSEVDRLANEAIQRQLVDDAERIEPTTAPPRVTIVGYEDGEAELELFYAGLAELNPESDQVAKSVFYGKTRDEVRRYVLSLDHVQSVDIAFTPAWLQTVPHVSDHVNVIIKSVK